MSKKRIFKDNEDVCLVGFKVSSQDYKDLKSKAHKNEMSLSQYLRRKLI